MKCPICRGICQLLGRLGELLHYRCRDCGMICNRKAPLKSHKF